MIVVTENTEEKMVELLDSLKGNTKGQNCIYLRLSMLYGEVPEAHKLANIIESVIDDKDARMMVCNDDDIFIIAKGVNMKIFEKIRLHVATFLGISSGLLAMKLYDLHKEFSVLSIICEEKLKLQIAKQQEAIENAKKREAVLDIDIEDELIKALKTTRQNRKQPTILIVEDDMFSRQLVTSSLSKEYNVSGAKDGKEAIQQYALQGPDVMFLDIELPDVDGHEVLQKILSFDPDAYIIMLSGKGDKNNVIKSMREGAKGFVGKPFAKEKLLQYISQCPTLH